VETGGWSGERSLQGQDVTLICDVHFTLACRHRTAAIFRGGQSAICPATYAEPGWNVAVEADGGDSGDVAADFNCVRRDCETPFDSSIFACSREAVPRRVLRNGPARDSPLGCCAARRVKVGGLCDGWTTASILSSTRVGIPGLTPVGHRWICVDLDSEN